MPLDARVDSCKSKTLDLELFLNFSIRLVEYSNLMKTLKRYQRMTIHYKWHYQPKFAGQATNTWEWQCKIALDPRRVKNQDHPSEKLQI